MNNSLDSLCKQTKKFALIQVRPPGASHSGIDDRYAGQSLFHRILRCIGVHICLGNPTYITILPLRCKQICRPIPVPPHSATHWRAHLSGQSHIHHHPSASMQTDMQTNPCSIAFWGALACTSVWTIPHISPSFRFDANRYADQSLFHRILRPIDMHICQGIILRCHVAGTAIGDANRQYIVVSKDSALYLPEPCFPPPVQMFFIGALPQALSLRAPCSASRICLRKYTPRAVI
jgi:hypothetical protein